MNSAPSFVLVHCTCPDQRSAAAIAQALLEKRLVACASQVTGVRSLFHWQGKLDEAEEVLLLLKTHASRYIAVEQTIKSMHPYQVPEIIALPIVCGSADYLNWVQENTCLN